MNPEVVIVHAVDTEGPLFESIEAKWLRLEEMFGIVIEEKTEANLRALLNGEIETDVPLENIRAVFSNHLSQYNTSWTEIDEMLSEIYTQRFRCQFVDSYDRPWKISWHCLDHIGYDANPRNRDLGHHKIFDRYDRWVREYSVFGDTLEWHFHPPSLFNEAHKCATLVFRNDNILQILSRKIIDRGWFPTSFRAGFHAERPDLNWFLEQWIPFDLSNISKLDDNRHGARDMQGGRFGDWRRAPSEWGIYSPSHDDYQVPGNCRRHIGRVLNVLNRLASIDEPELETAFRQAQESETPILVGITGHDFRDLRTEISAFGTLLQKVRERHPGVMVRFETTGDGFRRCLWPTGFPENPLRLTYQLYRRQGEVTLEVSTLEGQVFGPQPFLAIKTSAGRYIHDNLDFQEDGWTYVFNEHTVHLDMIEAIGIAASDRFGNRSVISLTEPWGVLS
jgi:hypothetical protein